MITEAVDLEALGPEALKEACVFASCFKVGASHKEIESSLVEWWGDVGKTMLVGSMDDEEDAVFSDEEDEAEGADQPSSETVQLEKSVDSAKALALVEEELQELQADPDMKPSDEKDTAGQADPLYSGDISGDEVEPKEGDAIQPLSPNVFTLGEVLEKAGLGGFAPPPEDREWNAFKRGRALLPHMRDFVSVVRVHEKILSEASVLGVKRPQNKRNVCEHQLGLARAAFSCSAARQSRHAIWQNYTERVLAGVKEEQENENCLAQLADVLGPSTQLTSDGTRGYQLLVVRPFKAAAGADGLRFGVPVSVWRCGRKSGNSAGRKLLPCGRVPTHMVTHLHVMLLMPVTPDNGPSYYIGTSLCARFQPNFSSVI